MHNAPGIECPDAQACTNAVHVSCLGVTQGHAVLQGRHPGLLSMTDDPTVVMFTVMMVMFQGNADL